MQHRLNFAPALKKENTSRQYEDIRRDYMKWLNKTKKGIRIYSDEYIFSSIADKFYKSSKTIENIVFNRV